MKTWLDNCCPSRMKYILMFTSVYLALQMLPTLQLTQNWRFTQTLSHTNPEQSMIFVRKKQNKTKVLLWRILLHIVLSLIDFVTGPFSSAVLQFAWAGVNIKLVNSLATTTVTKGDAYFITAPTHFSYWFPIRNKGKKKTFICLDAPNSMTSFLTEWFIYKWKIQHRKEFFLFFYFCLRCSSQ